MKIAQHPALCDLCVLNMVCLLGFCAIYTKNTQDILQLVQIKNRYLIMNIGTELCKKNASRAN